jgi:threonine dehydrogenase-like Zn-dependent dehydrogenase
MRALTWQGRRSVSVETVPDPVIERPNDAIIKVTSTAICGSDLHLYEVLGAFLQPGDVLGHETMGIVQDVGPEADFNPQTYVPKVMTIGTDAGEAGKTTIDVRKYDPARDRDKLNQPYVVMSTRCAHAGCPVRYVQAAQRFICPCHGGVYDFDGAVAGGPPVRPLDRFDSKVENGRVLVGARFSLDSELGRHKPRDPGEHLDGLWQYLYPSRPTT